MFTAAGNRDAADEIHFDERVWAEQKTSGMSFFLSSLLRYGAGYGIGSYMFRALYCALILSIVGAVVLRCCANKGVVELKFKHGWGRVRCFVWCFGASVNRLLPVLNLKKEFVEFFDKPEINQFTPCQEFFFVVFALFGWALSFIVIAAFATITRGP